jgi:hypothetical protein
MRNGRKEKGQAEIATKRPGPEKEDLDAPHRAAPKDALAQERAHRRDQTMGADDSDVKTWGHMDETERKEFANSWRAWKERALKVANRAKDLSPLERRVLMEIIHHSLIAESAAANAMVCKLGAPEMACLLGIHVSTAGMVRQRLRDKGWLTANRASGGRQMAAVDTVSLGKIETAEAEIEARPRLRKPPPSSAGVSQAKPPRSSTGVSATETPAPRAETPAQLGDINPRPAGRDALSTSSLSRAASPPYPAGAGQNLPAPAPAAAQGGKLDPMEIDFRMEALKVRLDGRWPTQRDRHGMPRWLPDMDLGPLRDAIAGGTTIAALGKGIQTMLGENVIGLANEARLARAVEIARARQAAYKPHPGRSPYWSDNRKQQWGRR